MANITTAITDFLYINYENSRIYGDKIVLHKGCGIYVYSNNLLIWAKKVKDFEIVKFNDRRHIIKWANQEGYWEFNILDIIFKDKNEDYDSQKENLKVGDKVISNEYIISKNEQGEGYSQGTVLFILCFDMFDYVIEHLNEIRKEFEWEILDITDIGRDIKIATIKKNDYIIKCYLDTLETIDSIIAKVQKLKIGH